MLVCIAIVYIFNESCGMSAIVNKRILYCIVLYEIEDKHGHTLNRSLTVQLRHRGQAWTHFATNLDD